MEISDRCLEAMLSLIWEEEVERIEGVEGIQIPQAAVGTFGRRLAGSTTQHQEGKAGVRAAW